MPFLGLSLKSLAGLDERLWRGGGGERERNKKRDKERSLFRDSLETSEMTGSHSGSQQSHPVNTIWSRGRPFVMNMNILQSCGQINDLFLKPLSYR